MTPNTISRLSRRLATRTSLLSQRGPKPHFGGNIRPLSTTPAYGSTASQNPDPKREAVESRHNINTAADEYAQSGSDDSAAKNEQAAFGRESDPQKAKQKAGEGNEVNPLDASPANPEISQTTSEVEGGADKKISEGGGGRRAEDEGKGSESI
jgi:hypothetical protein